MAKKDKAKGIISIADEVKLLQECQDHQADSERWMSTLRSGWDEKESMLIVKLEDEASKDTSSQIYDPRLSTIVFERAARVMAQGPKGKAYAVSRDDIGKNALMNLLLGHYTRNANEQYSFLIKLRMLDLYSLVYGSMFALVPWRVNTRSGFIGPELTILPIRNCFPQPGVQNIKDANWFTVRTVTNIDWLLTQDSEVWNMDAIKRLAATMKEKKDAGTGSDMPREQHQSYVEQQYYPTKAGDIVYPSVEMFTEYRHDRWITWVPSRSDDKTRKPYLLRVLKNPYPEGMLPIVAKHAFPLLDSPIGLGEFERGKTLQFAINSLINLYMDGVKYSIFPPVHINPNNVVPSSIKWAPGERWFMNNPNVDVQPMALSPQGLQTFNSTYGFMLSALYNQAGSTEISQTGDAPTSLGKTPEAIKFTAARETARDEWDRFMMEETIKDIYDRWIALIVDKLETDVQVRLFGDEIKEIEKINKDVVQLYKSKERGQVTVNKKHIAAKYDYELETGSTVRKDIDAEQENITSVLRAVTENPALLQEIRNKGKDIDVGELFKRWMIAGGIKDYDRIIVDLPPEVQGQSATQTAEGMAPATEELPPEGAPMPQDAMPEGVPPEIAEGFQDPEIAQAAAQIFGGTEGIPPTQ